MAERKRQPVMLCIMDGVGIAPAGPDNAVTLANTPTLDRLMASKASSKLRTDGAHVGLPEGQMGNSEVGHMTIGAGRIIRQSLDQIFHDLREGSFEHLPGFSSFVAGSKDTRAVHLVGMLSDGGVHSHIDHIISIAKLVRKHGSLVYIHGLLDGRDASPTSGKGFVEYVQDQIKDVEGIELATLVGRFYGMDRDNRWERMDAAWRLWTKGEGVDAKGASTAIEAQYAADVTDEFMPALNLHPGRNEHLMQDGDSVLICNFRADRARQILDLMLQPTEKPLLKPHVQFNRVASLTELRSEFVDQTDIVYPSVAYTDILGSVASDAGRTQLRISETEKYAHITYYLNCGREEPYEGETRVLIDSPRDVKTYDEKPEMSLPEVTIALRKELASNAHDLIILNIANGDQVGHTGSNAASVAAMEHVDAAVSSIIDGLKEHDGHLLVIADHGNVEELKVNGEVSTSHSTNPVPCLYVGPLDVSLTDGGLQDVCPTLLDLMGVPTPAIMTGHSLIQTTE